MGCGSSNRSAVDHPAKKWAIEKVMQTDTYKELLSIGLSKDDISDFQHVFYACVMNESLHWTDINKLMHYYQLNDQLSKRILVQAMRLHHLETPYCEKIGIRQFILQSFWHLSMDREALADFSFDISHISENEKGLTYSDLISMPEVAKNKNKNLKGTSIEDKIINLVGIFRPGMSNEMYMNPTFIKSVVISRSEFVASACNISVLLQPALEVQYRMRTKLFGVRFWKELEEDAVQLRRRAGLFTGPHHLPMGMASREADQSRRNDMQTLGASNGSVPTEDEIYLERGMASCEVPVRRISLKQNSQQYRSECTNSAATATIIDSVNSTINKSRNASISGKSFDGKRAKLRTSFSSISELESCDNVSDDTATIIDSVESTINKSRNASISGKSFDRHRVGFSRIPELESCDNEDDVDTTDQVFRHINKAVKVANSLSVGVNVGSSGSIYEVALISPGGVTYAVTDMPDNSNGSGFSSGGAGFVPAVQVGSSMKLGRNNGQDLF